MRLKIINILLVILVILISCENQAQQQNTKVTEPQKTEEIKEQPKQEVQEPQKQAELPEKKTQTNLDASVVGVWRAHRQSIVYDSGATNSIKPGTRKLTISEDGTWEFGTRGTWEFKPIEDKDWDKWNIGSLGGQTKKIVLNGWNNGVGDGPIEFGTEGVDFIWVVYRSEKLSLGPATIQIQFGH